eukprot:c27573_g1_i4 orf=1191-1478(-)
MFTVALDLLHAFGLQISNEGELQYVIRLTSPIIFSHVNFFLSFLMHMCMPVCTHVLMITSFFPSMVHMRGEIPHCLQSGSNKKSILLAPETHNKM